MRLMRVRRLTYILLPLTLLYITISSILYGRQQVLDSITRDAADTSLVIANQAQPASSSRHREIKLFNLLGSYGNDADGFSDLLPKGDEPHNDRILKQLEFVPKSIADRIANHEPIKRNMKIIFSPAGLGGAPAGQRVFIRDECPVNQCILEDDFSYRVTADAIVYHNEYVNVAKKANPNQIWILNLLESPFNTGNLGMLKDKINWTATYRTDSTIVTPYAKFVHFDNFTELPVSAPRDYLPFKTRQVAWFVSNCNTNNRRFDYARELQKYIQVDMYGSCGDLKCPRHEEDKCNAMLKRYYKFYLAFENSNCVHYITEKFFENALTNDVIPIVMGARRQDYEAVAPPHSFIHVDDFDSAKELSQYLLKVSTSPTLYNSYFRWKNTGYFMNTKFWCRVCAMLHGAGESSTTRWYRDVETWWRGNRTCVEDRWDDPDGFVNEWDEYVY